MVREGAVKRSRLELGPSSSSASETPSMTYEAFVEDLDPGDSFTTTLVETLVKASLAFWI